MIQTLTIDRLTLPATKGYKRVGRRPIGAWYFPRVGWRIYFDKAAQVRVRAYNVDDTILMPERGILTIRPTTPDGSLIPGTSRPGLGFPEDFRGGGAEGIDPCGTGGLLAHDRVMQRCAIGLYDLRTGKAPAAFNAGAYDLVRFRGPTGYAAPAHPKTFDGQHLVAAYTHAIANADDQIVQMDLRAFAYDCSLAWNAAREVQILSKPRGQGHGNVGREFAWVAYVAVMAQDRQLIARMRRIAQHVAMPWGGLQRLVEGVYQGGSPDPWEVSKVPHGIDVCQDFEQYHTVVALHALGLEAMASKLANAVCAEPGGRKWLNANTGQPIPECIHGGDHEQVLAAIGTQPAEWVKTAIVKHRIPRHKNYGGSNPPTGNLALSVQQLTDYATPGKTAWVLRKVR